jgi:AcrR family transcriptional regulator
VPRNRADIARDDKVGEIVAAARDRLVDGGYENLSVAGVARDLGLAQAAVYWYFPSKDHLLVAAVEGMFHDILAAKPPKRSTLSSVLWFTERLSEIADLRRAVRERARVSQVAAEFDRNMADFLRVMLMNALSDDGVFAPEDVADLLMALCEGVLVLPTTRKRKRELIAMGVERLVSG